MVPISKLYLTVVNNFQTHHNAVRHAFLINNKLFKNIKFITKK